MKTKLKLKLRLRRSLGYVTALLFLVMGLGLVGASGQAAAQATDPGSSSPTTPSISTKDSSSGSQQTYTFAVNAVIVGETSLPTGAVIVEVREGNILKARQTNFNVSSVGGLAKSTYQLLYQTNATQADIVFVRASDGSIMHTSPLSWNNAQAGARSFTDEFSWKLLGDSASGIGGSSSAGDQGIAATSAAVGGSGPLIDIEDTDKPVTVVTGLPDWAMQILGITPAPASASSASTATVVATSGTGNTLGTSGASTITTPGVTATTGKTISGANSSSPAASGTTAGDTTNNTSAQTGISQQVSTGVPVLRWIFIIVFSIGAIAFLLNFIQQTSFGRRVLSGFGSSSGGGGGANSTRRLRPGTLRPSFSFPKRIRTNSSRSDETTSGNGSTNASGVAAHKGKSKAKVGALPIATSVTTASAAAENSSSVGEVIGSTQGDSLQEATTTTNLSSEKPNTSQNTETGDGENKPVKTGAGRFWGRFKTPTIPQSQPQPSSAKNAQAQEEVTSKPSRLGSKGDRARVRPGKNGKGGKPTAQSDAEGWETQGLSAEDWGDSGPVPTSVTPTTPADAPALSRFQSFAPSQPHSQPQVEAQITNNDDEDDDNDDDTAATNQSVKPSQAILPPRQPQLLNFGSGAKPTFSADGGGDGDERSAPVQSQAQTLVMRGRDANTTDGYTKWEVEGASEEEEDTNPKKAQASEVTSSFGPDELEAQSQDTSEAFTLTTTPHTTAHSSVAPRFKSKISNGEGSPSASTPNPNKLSGSGLVLMPPPGQKIARNRGRTLGMGLAESGFEIEVARLIRSQGPRWLGATSVSVSKQVDLTGLARLVDQDARHKFFTPRQLAYLGNTSLDMVVEVQTLSQYTGQLEVSRVIVVEPDGPSHRRVEQQRKDAIKNNWIKSLGLPIIRLTQVNQLQDQLSQFARSPRSLQKVTTAPGSGSEQNEHDELESATGERERKPFIVSNTGIDTSANNSTGLAYSQLELEVAQTIQQEGAGWLGAYEVEVSKRVDPTWFLRAAGITPLNEHKQFSSDQLLYLKHTNLGMVVEVRLSENMTVDYMIVVEVDNKPSSAAFGSRARASATDPLSQNKALIKNSWVTKLGYPLIRVEDLDQLESAFLNLAEKMAQLGVRPIRANTKGGKVIGNVFRRLGSSSGGDKAATATTTSVKGKSKSKLKPQPKKKSA